MLLAIVLGAVVIEWACAGAVGGDGSSGGSGGGEPKGPTIVVVTLIPATASVSLGATQQFQATVTGTSNNNVSWQVNGIAGGNSSIGTIEPNGPGATYAAPTVMPSSSIVTITAVSQANSAASGSARVTLTDELGVTVSPKAASVPTGGEQLFTASIDGTGPSSAVTWNVNGIAGGDVSLGTIVTTGAMTAIYTAPPAPPSPATLTITATSVADSAKSGSASVTITCGATNSISPPSASVSLNGTQVFSASFCLPGAANVAWDVDAIAGGNASVGTIISTGQAAALYTAPADAPPDNPLTIHAIAPGGAGATASITITSNISVRVSPATATLAVGQRATFTPVMSNDPDQDVTWSVNGVANGNATVGQVCQTGSNPCAAPSGPTGGAVDFIAPAAAPSSNPVILTATSRADASRSGSATILITSESVSIGLAVAPLYAFVVPSGGAPSTEQFFATVTGTLNTAVTWSVQTAVAGQGCAGAACGSVDANGVYTAPSTAPSPNAIAITATNVADPTKSAFATIAITSGPTIEVLLPSSVMAGAVEAFPLEVQGVNFVAGSGGSGTVILLNGIARSTTCASTTSCATSLSPSDVQTNGTLSIQARNPGNPGALSNPVPFVVVPFSASAATISLSSSHSSATGQDVIVAEPTTAAGSQPINVNFVGLLIDGNTCGAQGSPLTVTAPTSGSSTVGICVNGNGLDSTFTYAFTGSGGAPDGTDIGVSASAIAGLFPGTIELDLQISSATLHGVRTLVITTPNDDRAVATGMLEVK